MKPTTMIELGRRVGAVEEKGQALKAALTTMNNRCAMIDDAAPAELKALAEDFERIQSLGAEIAQAARQAASIAQRAMVVAAAPVTRGDGVAAEPEPKATRERRPRKKVEPVPTETVASDPDPFPPLDKTMPRGSDPLFGSDPDDGRIAA